MRHSDVPGSKNSSLRAKIIRLAHQNPEYRSALKPLLQAIAAQKDDRKELKKQYKKLLEQGGSKFGVLSSHKGSGEEDKARHAQLVADLTRLRYRKISPLKGEGDLFPKGSVLVHNMRPKDLFELGRKYQQKTVLFANEQGFLGIYSLEGDPTVRVILDPKGDPAFRSLTDKTPYSESKGLEAEHGYLWSEDFPWDGQNALTRKSIRLMVQQKGMRNLMD